jgi:DNA helicase-2/ATP-dependent DNA helicase PcrA
MPDFTNILNSLNPEQSEATSTTEGPLLVLAGAGTGKTKVLTTRIAYILQNRLAFPSQILAVTFTNKAAKEMEHRIFSMVGDVSAGLWLGTFHSICLKILRRNYTLIGLRENFTIINSDDQLRLTKQIISDLKIDEKRYNPKAILAQINRWKDRALEPKDISDGDVAGQVYEIYQKRCLDMNIIDFGDIILKTIVLLKNNQDVLNEYQRKFKYILVDEYQDTNVSQYLWLRLLALQKHNICCVGDDDQSIYGWRGAEVGNILKFEKDFEGAKIIRLETNYRSSEDILNSANSLIANNASRLGKTLKPHNASGNKVKLVSVWDDRAEANYIADEIEAMQQLKKNRLDDIAILVRAGYQTRAFEECFIRKAIPYRILGGLRFYERLEIRDATSYIRAILVPENDLALERIINVPKRGIGDKSVENFKLAAKEQNISLNQAIKNALMLKTIKGKTADSLATLFTAFDKWKNAFQNNENHAEVVKDILEQSGYMQMWKDEKTLEAQGRIDNLKELLNALSGFRDIDEFLEHTSLVSEADDRPLEDMVSIMTIHGAKGLEFKNVFLPGWEDGLFPSQQSMDEKGKEGLEEERRLAYVAITRAKENLTISFASSRMVFGNIVSSIPSRFIDELPPEHIEIVNQQGLGPQFKGRGENIQKASFANEKNNQFIKDRYTIENRKTWNKSEENNNKKPASKFSVGDKIYHDTFGFGRVLNVNGKHLQIVFEKSAIKTLLEDFVNVA